ncbi:MAG: hypothetical protein EOO81_05970 [Oxalobacteraceae bacterium]|nr:MAG: hypothetical protein EOO81_05970 [Oxalobacteraceae bacterium]
MMKLVFMAVAAASLFAACAQAQLRKEGMTAAEQRSDTADCESMARKSFPPGDPSMSNANSIEIEQAMRVQAYIKTCLRSKGWQ